MNVTMPLNLDVKAKASSGYDDNLIKKRLDFLSSEEQNEKVVEEIRYLRALLSK